MAVGLVDDYRAARRHHAFRLRVLDRLTYRQIGDRLGISVERTRQLVWLAARHEQVKWRKAGYTSAVSANIVFTQIRLGRPYDEEIFII